MSERYHSYFTIHTWSGRLLGNRSERTSLPYYRYSYRCRHLLSHFEPFATLSRDETSAGSLLAFAWRKV